MHDEMRDPCSNGVYSGGWATVRREFWSIHTLRNAFQDNNLRESIMPQRVEVGPVTSIPPGRSLCVKANGDVIAVFNCDGTFYAISDMCPHAGAPLSQGIVDGSQVTCAWHGWTFEMDAAKCPRPDGIDRYPVVVEDGVVMIEIPD